ncbi:MAG: CheR family methyltransferase [Myxococcota bacterium]
MSAPNLSDAEFDDLRAYLQRETGIAIAADKSYLIETRLADLVTSEGLESYGSLLAHLSGPEASLWRERLVDAMTTNETLWFRDDGPWRVLEDVFLPIFVERLRDGASGKIRIWCAGCSTGQEPYSVAMTVAGWLARQDDPVDATCFEILGSDISPSAIFSAVAGRYDAFAAKRGLSEDARERYFSTRGNALEVRPEIRQMVAFERRNLADDFSALGTMDLVFCRNVLIYFANELRRDVIARLETTIRPGGGLLLGGAESLHGVSEAFSVESLEGSVYYLREGGAA